MDARTLIEGLEANACTVHEATWEHVASLVTARVAEVGAAGPVAVGAGDARLLAAGVVDALRAGAVPVLTSDDPDWHERLPDATVGVTSAALAVEVPAMLALGVGPGAPRATSLLPPVHICVVRVSDLMPTFEDAIAWLAPQPKPSAWTWVGGPSRTGDLEMQQTLGVHGPVAVEVVVVDA